jgi:tetratricopeptide (TPR) repeat protein
MTTTKPKMCLNMIVKNEAHCIKETLRCMLKYIDYYVISDTGSTDGTENVISKFFDKKNIKGEIHHNEWKDFGHNRTVALQLCKGKSEYIWVIDADDLIVGDLVLPQSLTHDAYSLTFGKGFTYQRTQIFKNTQEFDWFYVGVVHEYPNCSKSGYSNVYIKGNYYVDSRRIGARNKVENKYLGDAKKIEEALEKNPDDERNVFYLAQSYFDAGMTEKGIEVYKKRISMGRWPEEVYYSYYRIANGLKLLKKPWDEIEKAYLECHNYMPSRAEPLYQIMRHYRDIEDHQKAYYYGKKAINIKYPEHLVLFVDKHTYDYEIPFELSICSFYIGKYEESHQLCMKLLLENKIEDYLVTRIKSNMLFSQEKLKNNSKKSVCLYLGSLMFDIKNLTNHLANYYDVYVVSNCHICASNIFIINDISVNLECDYLICFDSLNYFHEKNKGRTNIEAKKKILYMTDEHFKIYATNGLSVTINSVKFLANIYDKIDLLVCDSDDTRIKISRNYLFHPDKIKIFDFFSEIHYCSIFDHDRIEILKDLKIRKEINDEFIVNELCTPTNGDKNILKKYYKNTMEYFKDEEFRDEIELHLVKLCNGLGQYNEALEILAKILKNCKNREILINKAIHEKAKCLFITKKYEEAYTLMNYLLGNFKLANLDKKNGEHLRDMCIEHIQHMYLKYPVKQIINICNNLKKTSDKDKKVMLTMTTCKRYDLFEKTVNSFINSCRDLQLIDHYLCVDDNSSEDDRNKMTKLYPFFEYVFKNENEKGHYKSMNIIYNKINEYNIDYILHLEDDWHFIEQKAYTEDALDIFNSNAQIGQVLFNINYIEIERHKQKISGGHLLKSNTGRSYIVHEHYEVNTPEYEEFVKRHGSGMCCYWPHFSFRPSIIKCDVLKKIGPFINTPHFEMQYAKEYIEHGYKSAFFDTFSCIHIGKKTWESSGSNSYKLNKTNQFYMDDKKLSIKIISDDINIWKSFKEKANNILPFYVRKNIKKITQLNDQEKQMFHNNNFNYDRNIINIICTHIDILCESNSEFMIVLFDSVDFCEKFEEKIKNILKNYTETQFDVAILDNFSKMHNKTNYLISKKGIDKIKQNISKICVKEMNDFFGLFDLVIYKSDDPLVKCDDIIESKSINKFEDYKLYSNMDSYGNDIIHHANKNLEELKKLADDDEKCVGFNTLGYLKYNICDEKNMIYLWKSTKTDQGLYVKIPSV